MKLQDSKTYQNLARAYVGETQSYVRYQFIEYGARNQGYNALAEVVDKIVYNEFNHARLLYTLIQQSSKEQIDNIDITAGYPFKEKWDLTENFALAAEDHETEIKLYKSFEKTARSEGFEDIANTFKMLADVEKQHKKTFEDLHKQLKDGTLYKKENRRFSSLRQARLARRLRQIRPSVQSHLFPTRFRRSRRTLLGLSSALVCGLLL